jgi:hypothetical protein
MAQIPSVSYAIRNALDRLQWQAGVYNDEFVQRLKLVFGHPDYFDFPANGVVSEADPGTATAGSALPLAVNVNAENPLNVDVNPGLAVTLSGQWVLLPENARNVALANTALDIPNVVYISYKLVDGPIEANDEKKPVVTFTQRPEDDPDTSNDYVIDTDTVDNYLSVQESVLADRVALCVVTVVNIPDPETGVTSPALSFDFTQNSYPWNRPWFSAVDIEHRSMVGSGSENPNNPHRITLNEVSVGPFGPLELQLDHGAIIGKSQSADKVPGYKCEAAVPASNILQDDINGTKTGFTFGSYIELGNFPVRVGRVRLKSNDDDIPSLWVPETNRIVFPTSVPVAGDSILINYTRVEACEPPLRGSTTYSTNNPKTDEELILSGGRGITALDSTEETFADAHQFPMRYIMFVDAEGNLLKAPQVVYCYKRLEDLSTADTPDITQYGNAILQMGLTGAGPDPAMIIKIRVYGLDENGNNVDYLFEFDGGSWVDPGPVGVTTVVDAGYQFSVGQLFSEITSVEVEERSDDSPNSAIMIWACINPRDTREQMEQAAVVADTMWDGSIFYDVRDKRIVMTTTRDFLISSDGKMMLEAHIRALGGNITTLYVDDARMPQLGSLELPREFNSTNEAFYSWGNMDQLYVGRQGVYRTRALPIFPGSGIIFRVMTLPQGDDNRTYRPPSIRFFAAGGWTSFITMSPVPGVPHAYENPAVIGPNQEGLQVQLPYDLFYQSHLLGIFGTAAP